jgi:hypothetical protein
MGQSTSNTSLKAPADVKVTPHAACLWPQGTSSSGALSVDTAQQLLCITNHFGQMATAVLPLFQVRTAVLQMQNRKTFDTAYGHAFVRYVTLVIGQLNLLTVAGCCCGCT